MLQRFAGAVLLAALSVVAGCGGAGTGALPTPNSGTLALAAGSTTAANANLPSASTSTALTVTPLAASAFNDSVGVNTHLSYSGSPYDTGYATWSPTLLNSRIKHVRDGLCNWGTSSSFCTRTWAARWNQFAAAGIKFAAGANPWIGFSTSTTGCHGTCVPDFVASLGLAQGSIDAWEGPNECDEPNSCTAYGTQTQTAVYTVDNWMPLVSKLRSPSVKIYGPAMAFSGGYAQFGNLSQYLDFGSIHDYPGGNWPENNVVPHWQAGASNMSGNLPLVSTETGYNTDPTFANNGVSQLAQERYSPRLLFTHLHYGIKRTYFYEMFDYPATPGSGQLFGLLNADFTPKPIWTRLTQLMSYFADTGTSPNTPLTYTLSGDSSGTLQQLLFQRSDASYILVPWLATQLWNRTSNTDMAPIKETLALSLPSTVTSVTVTQFGDHGSTTVTTLSRSNGTFSLPVSSLIEAVKFHT